MSTSREQIRAHHEAGHAVVARLLGTTVVRAAIFSTGVGEDASVLTHSAEHLTREGDLLARLHGLKVDAKVALAGPYAQRKYRPNTNRKRASCAEWALDLRNAESSAVKIVLLRADPHRVFDGDKEVTLTPEEVTEVHSLFSRFGADVRAMLDEHWPAVERVAGALLKSRIVSGDEIDALIAGR